MPNNVSNVSFQAGGINPYGIELSDIERRRRLAEAMQQQGMTPLGQTESVGGWAVRRSPLEGMAKMAQAYSGTRQMNMASEQERALAGRYQSELASTLSQAIQAGTGAPGTTLPEGLQGPNIPAQAPDRAKMVQILMQHPATQQLGAQQLMNDMNRQALIAAFRNGGAQPPIGGATAQPGAAPQGVEGQTGGASSLGGNAGGIPLEAWAYSDPTGKSYLAALAQQNAPVNVRQGGAVYDPVTGQPKFVNPQSTPGVQIGFGPTGASASPIPGYNQAASGVAAATAGAQAGAKAPWETVPVTSATGAVTPTPLTQIPGIGQSAQAPSTGVNPGTFQGTPQQIVGQIMRLPDSQQLSAFQSYAKSLQGTGQQPPSAPIQQQVAQPPETPLRNPGAVTLNQVDPWSTIPKPAVPTGIGQTTENKGMAETRVAASGRLSEKMGTLAEAANQRRALNNQALSLVDSADTGPMAATIADVKNLLVSRFGVPESDFKNTPSATLALQKDLVNSATAKAKQQFGARITQSEVNLMLQRGSPNVDMTKAAINYLIKSDNAAADYQLKQANDFGKYSQMGGDPLQYEAWYAKNFPMTQSLNSVHFDTKVTPQSIADEMRRRGLIK